MICFLSVTSSLADNKMVQISMHLHPPDLWHHGYTLSRKTILGRKEHIGKKGTSPHSKGHTTSCQTTQQKRYGARNVTDGAGEEPNASGATKDHTALTDASKDTPNSAGTSVLKPMN